MTALAGPGLGAAESVTAVGGAARLSSAAWNRLAHRGFHRHRWFVVAEQCGWRPRHLAVEGREGPVAVVPVYLTDGRTPNDLHDRWLGPFRASVMRAALGPRPTLSVQAPFSLASDVLGDASSLSDTALHRVFDALEQQAAADDALAVVWPFIERGSEALLRVGRARGYAEVYAGATARLRVHWDGFDGYLASRSRNLRRTIREDLKALDATGARLTCSSEFQREAGAMDRLYRRAYRRRNRRESPLARDFCHRLAETPSLDLLAQLTWRGARLVGISVNLPTRGLQDGTFAAFEEGDRGGPAYYNDLVYEPLRRACREQVAELDLGPTALYAKVLRGAVLRPRTTLIRGTTPLAPPGALRSRQTGEPAPGVEGAARARPAVGAALLRGGRVMLPRLLDAALAYRLEGLRGVWDIMAPHSVYRLIRFGRYVVFAQSTDAPEVAPGPGVAIRRLVEEDWPALAGIVTQLDLARFRWLANRGHICLLALRAGRPVGYAWVADRIGPDVTLCDFPLPPHAAYLWELYVLPAERRSGVGSALASARLRVARDRGFREGWRMIAPGNRASLRTLEKSGGSTTRMVGQVRFLKLLSLMRVRLDGWPAPTASSS